MGGPHRAGRAGRADRRDRRPRLAALGAGLLSLGLAAGACTSGSTDANPPPTSGAPGKANLTLAAALARYDTCEDAVRTIRAEAKRRVTPYGLPNSGSSAGGPDIAIAEDVAGIPTPAAAPTTTAPSASRAEPENQEQAAAGGSGSGAAHSTTNVQEAGVDEPDQVKTDGSRLFVVNGATLYAYEVGDGGPRLAGTLSLDRGANRRLLLSEGNRLLVLSDTSTSALDDEVTRAAREAGDDVVASGGVAVGSELTEVDASDLANLRETSQIAVDGSIVDARLVGSTARVVIRSTPSALTFVQPTSSTAKARNRALQANKEIIDDSSLEDWLPTYSVAGTDERRPLVDCANVSHPKQFGGFGALTVMTVNIGSGINPRHSISIQADADRVYASKDRLYVSTNQLPEPGQQDQAGPSGTASNGVTAQTAPGTAPPPTRGAIECDPACPPPTTRAPSPPVPSPVPVPDPSDYRTAIHEFDISGTGPASYVASGDVRGQILDDFALSEHDGYLRVATTDGAPWAGRSNANQSFVTVLHEEGGTLKQVGQVGGLGRNEQIYSVRFVGDTGYVVTFRRTDPLYTVDLRDPRNPRVAGELELLGYSAYLHPVGDGRLLGIGQDATASGRVLGTQVALFDVADPASPKLLKKATLPGASSEAEQDYHAFLYWDPTQLAVIPVQQYGASVPSCPPDADCAESAAPTSAFVGAIGYRVTAEGVTEAGRIVQPGGTPRFCEFDLCPTTTTIGNQNTTTTASTVPPDGQPVTLPPGTTVGPPIDRTVVIGDHVYTVSDTGLLMSDLSTLAPQRWYPFA